MIVLKYRKAGSWRFVSHIELLRHAARIIRRARIPVKFSNGFNPHALLFFSPPLVLGAASEAEYLALDTDMEKEELFERYNSSVSEDLKASAVFQTAKNPNLQGKIEAADYVFPVASDALDLSGGLKIDYVKKGETVSEEVSDRVFAVSEKNGLLLLTLAAGNVNVRPDRLLDFICAGSGQCSDITEVVKTAQYVRLDGELTDVDIALASGLI